MTGAIERIAGTLTGAGRLDRALADALAQDPALPQLSRARVQALIAGGRVCLGGRIAASGSAKVSQGASFTIDLPAATPLAAQPQDIALVVIYEDAHLIVVDKPAGLVVHPAAGNRDGTLVNALLHHCRGSLSGIGGVARPGIVHRIDKDTSGLLVVAKSDAAHEGLARQFAAHSLERAYSAITRGWPRPAEGTIVGRIGRSSANRQKMAVLEPGDSRGKHAVTHYRVVERLGAGDAAPAALVECRLETGRTHQVRVHMASIGHALLGDPAYGGARNGGGAGGFRKLLAAHGFARQALHAAVLGFVHPVSGEAMRFTSLLPDDMREILEELRLN